jgi:ABC-2 type transport system permease protein
MWQLKAYWRVLMIAAREDSANPKRLVVAVLQLLGRMALIVAIYHAAYLANPKPGLAYANALWSVGIYLAFVLALGIRNVVMILEADIKSGAVETQLVRPLDWRIMALCQLIGKNGLEFLIQVVAIPLLLWAMVGPPDMSFMTWPLVAVFIVLVVMCVVAVSAMFLLVGMSAFWLNDAKSMFRIVDKLMAGFSGAFVPIALMPAFMQTFVRLSPFGVYASPQNIFNPHFSNLAVPVVVAAIFWAIALWLLCEWVWRRAQRRIEVNGG